MYLRDMAAMQFLLLLACVALSTGAGAAGAPTKTDAEMEAEAEAAAAEAAGAAEIKRALSALQSALSNPHEPWSRRLETARDALTMLLAALEAHAATLVLHSRHCLDRLQPQIEEKLEEARALLARTKEEVAAGVAGLAMSPAVREAGAAVARAAEILGSLWPAPGSDAASTPYPWVPDH